MKKLLFAVVPILLTMVLAAYGADVTGKWVAELPGRDGGTMQQVFNLKSEGGKVTGTLSMEFGGQTMEQKIVDGKLEGDKISFTTVAEFGGNEIRFLYSGTVSGKEMRLTRTREGAAPGGGAPGGRGGRGPTEIVAKKVD